MDENKYLSEKKRFLCINKIECDEKECKLDCKHYAGKFKICQYCGEKYEMVLESHSHFCSFECFKDFAFTHTQKDIIKNKE